MTEKRETVAAEFKHEHPNALCDREQDYGRVRAVPGDPSSPIDAFAFATAASGLTTRDFSGGSFKPLRARMTVVGEKAALIPSDMRSHAVDPKLGPKARAIDVLMHPDEFRSFGAARFNVTYFTLVNADGDKRFAGVYDIRTPEAAKSAGDAESAPAASRGEETRPERPPPSDDEVREAEKPVASLLERLRETTLPEWPEEDAQGPFPYLGFHGATDRDELSSYLHQRHAALEGELMYLGWLELRAAEPAAAR